MKVLIVYGSLLGKTARIANLIGEVIQVNNIDVTIKDVRETQVYELNSYNLIILGSSTWDDGQLQFDFRSFNSNLEKTNFHEKLFAVFCLGSNKYPHPFAAGDILQRSVISIQGTLLTPVLKLDIDHDDLENKKDKEVLEWVGRIVEYIMTSK